MLLSLSVLRRHPATNVIRQSIAAHRDAIPAIGIAALLATILTGGVLGDIIAYDHAELDPTFLALGVLWTIGIALNRLGAGRFGAAAQLMVAFLLVGLLTALVSAMLATSALPYADNWLAAMDRHLLPWFHWPDVMLAIQDYRLGLLALSHAYVSLGWQPFLLLAVVCAMHRKHLGWRFLTAWSVTLLLSLLAFPWCPARGAYVHYGLTPEQVPSVQVMAAWKFFPLIEGLRNGSITMLSTRTLDGIITMPSFHAGGAVVLGWGFAHIRYLRWPFLALNTVMFASAIPIGGHYAIDVAAGALVATAAILLACRIHRRASDVPTASLRHAEQPS